jgi:Anti-sigma-K factor rskA
MTHSPNPENWQELMAGYALGDLSSEEAEALQTLLTENPELTSEVTQFQEVLALMPYALPDPEPPPRLREAILSQAESEKRPIGIFGAGQSGQSPRRNRIPWGSLGGAIAALALVAIGVDNYRLRQETQKNQMIIGRLQQEAAATAGLTAALQQPDAKLYALEGTGKASGSLVAVPGKRQMTLVAKGLPELSAGKVYRLWAIAANATKPTYCGEFNAKPISSWTVDESAVCGGAVTQMLVTSELASDPPIPKGDLVMKSKG